MCLAIPARVTELKGDSATVDMLGNKRVADVSLIEKVSLGDYVLLHAGFAIQKLETSDAEETLGIFREMEDGLEDQEG